ncbi:SRPBCC domain-containing protein [Amycolatopsis sp. NPDC051758]|uniref:SRPBCC domain-containing protein n=1 Tax=Amycolatopsis sp. NPDC051758 TaxID=3363935 RepID=UPI0037BBC1DE
MPDDQLTITRVFDAPRELVFGAWTDPDRLASWLGPHGYTGAAVTLATRPGGAWRACIRAPDGDEHWMHGVYREIAAPERLVFTFTWDTDGDLRAETLVTIDFADRDGKTEMTFTQRGFPTAADRDGHHDGWTSCFEDLTGFIRTRGKDAR